MPAAVLAPPAATGPEHAGSSGAAVDAAHADSEGPQLFRWTRERYERAVDAGVFTPEDDVELVDGVLVEHMSQNEPHAVTVGLVADALRAAFGAGHHVREEKPVALSDRSEPEPDVIVVRGARRDYLGGHPDPADSLLAVEVSDSTLRYDRETKAPLYAAAAVGEFWIVNLRERVLEVYREPSAGRYGSVRTLGAEGSVAPLARPGAPVAVADLLP